MIYIENTDESQGIFIPVTYGVQEDASNFSFALKNTVDLTRPIAEMASSADFNADFNIDFSTMELKPLSTASGQYMLLIFSLSGDLQDGTYEYIFRAGDHVISTGIAMIGNFDNDNKQYDKDITYKQYGE